MQVKYLKIVSLGKATSSMVKWYVRCKRKDSGFVSDVLHAARGDTSLNLSREGGLTKWFVSTVQKET